MNIAYVRVSTVDQNEERQIENLKKYDIEKWFIEKVSGKDTNRPELHNMMDFARLGDTIYIHDLSRLARSTSDLLKLVRDFEKKNVHLVSTKESIDSSTPTGRLMLTMIGAINQFELENLHERQREGIAIAKENGKYKGRKRVVVPDIGKHYEKYMARKISLAGLAKELGVARPTIYKLINEYRNELGLKTKDED